MDDRIGSHRIETKRIEIESVWIQSTKFKKAVEKHATILPVFLLRFDLIRQSFCSVRKRKQKQKQNRRSHRKDRWGAERGIWRWKFKWRKGKEKKAHARWECGEGWFINTIVRLRFPRRNMMGCRWDAVAGMLFLFVFYPFFLSLSSTFVSSHFCSVDFS